jgi:iron complex outermembrane receptor protein
MKTFLMSSAALAAMMIAAPAMAQDAPPAGDATSVDDVAPADIVVTAQKRSERLQDVPIAVSVISGDLIAASGAINIEGAQYLVPTLNFRKSGTTINQSLFMRGVGTSTFSIAGEPSISTVVDGVVYSRAGEAFSDLIDIDRLEVLRGPQGTLFGKNTSAGAINIITKRPGDTLGGYAEGAFYFENGNEYRVRAAIDVPLSETIKSRFTGFYGNYDGNIRNLTVGERVNGYDHWGVRGMIVAEPTPDVTITLIGDYRRSKDNCCAEVIGTTPTNLTATVLPPARGNESREIRQDFITRTNETSWGASLQIDATLGKTTFTSISAYRKYDNEEIRDGDFLDRAYVGFNQLHDIGPQTGNTITQEVRLQSPGGEFLDYVIGGFYSRSETERTFTRNDIVCTIGTAPPSTTALVPCSTPGTVNTQPSGTATFGSVFDNFALFGQATANVTESLRLIAGLRYTTDELSVFHRRRAFGLANNAAGIPQAAPGIQPAFDQGVYNEYLRLVSTGVAPNVAANNAVVATNGIPFRAETENDNWSGRVGVQYDIVPQSTFYATYTRGYKGPAFNVFFNLNSTGTNVIEPETSDAYEVGLKNSLLDGRLVINLAAFYAKYDNFQANNPDEVAGVIVTRFTNAGEISTRGFEVDLIWRPVTDLNISGGVAYTDAKVDQFRVPTNGNLTGVVPSGTRLAYAPEWKGSLNANYRLRTGGGIDFEIGAQGSYQSEQISQFDANPAVRAATTIKGYGLVDLQASVLDADERFKLTFQVKNLFDQSFASSITSGGPGGSYRYIIPREADRYFGVIGRVNF